MKTFFTTYTKIEICRNCLGSGIVVKVHKEEKCSICNGSGKIRKTTEVTKKIEPA